MSLSHIWVNKKDSRSFKFWTDDEIKYLEKLWIDNVRVEEIAGKLSRSYSSIRSMLLKLDLPPRRLTKVWSVEDENKLRMIYKNKTNHELACIFGLTDDQVRCKLNHMGLARKKVNSWTDEEVGFLLENKDIKKNSDIAKHLGRGVGSIRAKLYNMRKEGKI